MNFRFTRAFLAGFWLLALVGAANAECAFGNPVPVSVLLPQYPFWKPVGDAMGECGKVTVNYTVNADSIGTPASQSNIFENGVASVEAKGQGTSTGNKRLETILGVSVGTIEKLARRGVLRPMDDLVEKYGQSLAPRQLIRHEGRIIAIAVTANGENLVVHEDLFKREKLTIPETYSDLLSVVEKLKSVKLFDKPIAMAFKDGWNVANQFVNFFLADSGVLLDQGNRPAINNEKGIAALNQMIALVSYMPENFDQADSSKVQDDLLKGQVAMAILWASSAPALDNPAISRVVGRMKLVPPPAIVTGGKPAGTIWWDGFAISVSSTNEEAEAAFQVAMEGLDAEMLAKNRDAAIWLMKDYKPGRFGEGVIAAIEKGMPFYPASEATSMLSAALGEQIPKFLKGKISAEAALQKAEADYVLAARERGLLTN